MVKLLQQMYWLNYWKNNKMWKYIINLFNRRESSCVDANYRRAMNVHYDDVCMQEKNKMFFLGLMLVGLVGVMVLATDESVEEAQRLFYGNKKY